MNAIADIADRIMALPERNRSGTLQIWGQWFGRPMDNVHVCKSCEARQDHIVLGFDNGERLAVWYPEDMKTAGSRSLLNELLGFAGSGTTTVARNHPRIYFLLNTQLREARFRGPATSLGAIPTKQKQRRTLLSWWACERTRI